MLFSLLSLSHNNNNNNGPIDVIDTTPELPFLEVAKITRSFDYISFDFLFTISVASIKLHSLLFPSVFWFFIIIIIIIIIVKWSAGAIDAALAMGLVAPASLVPVLRKAHHVLVVALENEVSVVMWLLQIILSLLLRPVVPRLLFPSHPFLPQGRPQLPLMLPPSAFPSLSDVCSLSVATLFHVPKGARDEWSAIFHSAVSLVVSHPEFVENWI